MELPEAQSKQIAVIAGPTGSGESTITNSIIRRYPRKVTRLVTATTRAPRKGEQNGVDYYFFNKEDFAAKEKAGELLETTYIKNRDTHYGTYLPDLKGKLDAGFIILINPDIVGAKFYKKYYDATTVFVMPGNMEEVPGRLRARNPEMSEDEIQKRYQNALREVAEERSFYDFEVVNADGKLDIAVEQVIGILQKEGYNL
jgi:guanylate kinase